MPWSTNSVFYRPLSVSESKIVVEKSHSVGLAIDWLPFGGVSELSTNNCFNEDRMTRHTERKATQRNRGKRKISRIMLDMVRHVVF